jgi:recombination protein RecA
MSNVLQDLANGIKKKAKGVHASILSESEIATSTDNLQTPAYDLNRILSGSLFKGIPSRSLSLFVGPEASGKSSFMCLCLAEAQKKGYNIIVLDTEGAWTKEFVERWGLDPENVLLIYTPWVDEIISVMGQIMQTDEKYAIVVDSMGAMERSKLVKDAKDGEFKADQGMLQKEQKRLMKMLQNISIGMNSIVMCSGHFYGSPSQYGAAEEVGGGKYMKLAPQIIISLKKTKIFEGEGKSKRVVGNAVKAIAFKNRFYPPFEEAVIEIDYRLGINRYAGMIDLATKAGLCEVGGAWYTINDQKYQGRINAEKAFEEDPELLGKLETWLSDTGYSTLNEEIKEIEEPELEEEIEDEDYGPEDPDFVPKIAIGTKK